MLVVGKHLDSQVSVQTLDSVPRLGEENRVCLRANQKSLTALHIGGSL